MKKLIYFLVSGILAGFLVFSACEKVEYPPLEKPSGVSYADTIQPIFDAKCIACHGGSRDPDLRPGNSYNALINGAYINTGNPAESKLLTTLYGNHNDRATDPERQLILSWIEEGAQDN